MEKVFESEYRFLCVLWDVEPVCSTELVRLCLEKLGWKKSTTYTVIRKLAGKGMVKNEHTIISSLVTKQDVDRKESNELLQRISNGNIPEFLSALFKGRRLTREDVDRLHRIIEEAAAEE